MKATGSVTERTIWNYFIVKGMSPAGVAGLMGNLYAESGLNPQNLQNTYEKRLGFTDAEYTAAVDFREVFQLRPGQRRLRPRTVDILEPQGGHAQLRERETGASIGDLIMQLDFMYQELKGYVAVFQVLRTARTVKEASDIVLTRYERPADMSSSVKAKRASYGQAYYDAYANFTTEEGSTMSNSPLVTYTNITKNKTSPRNHAIDTVTIHCIVGQWTAKQGCDYFATTDRQCSANYVVGKDGSIGLSVDEADRSWCSSSRDNDNRAITIEVASDTEHPYAVTAEAYAALIDLLVDICQRNGIKQLLWKADKNLIGQVDQQNMTVHRWFANKACPGEYLYERHGAIAEEVNKRLGVSSGTATAPAAPAGYPETPFLVNVIISDLNYRKGPGMSYAVRGQTGKGTFTIVEVQDGWGKLKSGAGWIYLENPDYCTVQGVAATPAAPDPADVLAQEIADQVKGSGLDAADVLNRIKKILGVA